MGLVVIDRAVFPEHIVLVPIWEGTPGYISLSRTHSFIPNMGLDVIDRAVFPEPIVLFPIWDWL